MRFTLVQNLEVVDDKLFEILSPQKKSLLVNCLKSMLAHLMDNILNAVHRITRQLSSNKQF